MGKPPRSTIDIYQDFQCPACKPFEQQTGSTIDQWSPPGGAVVYHPVAILDRYSPDRYSSRSSAASGCAAADGVFPQYRQAALREPAEENSRGCRPTSVSLGQQAGGGPGFATCVQSQKYAPWTAEVTDQASKDGLPGTPTVKVDGQQIQDPTPDAVRAAVAG